MFWLYTPDLVRVGLIEGYNSMVWHRHYYEPGQFQMTIPFCDLCKLMTAEMLIVKGDEAGIIENIRITQNQKGENVFVCSGRFLLSYLDRRILAGVNSFEGTPENCLRYLVNKNAVTERAIQHLSVAASMGYSGAITLVSKKENLLEAIRLIAEEHGLGQKIEFSTEGIRYRVYAGLDRTVDQSVNPRAIFSRAFENVLQQSYDVSMKPVKNVTYVEATYTANEKEYPLARTVGTATGRDRREVYFSAGSLTSNDQGQALSMAQRNAAMDDRGREQMVAPSEAFTADVDECGNLQYKVDYDLGDIVTVESREMGMRTNLRITEIKEVYEHRMKLELVVGKGLPSFAKTVRWLKNG